MAGSLGMKWQDSQQEEQLGRDGHCRETCSCSASGREPTVRGGEGSGIDLICTLEAESNLTEFDDGCECR